MGPAGAGLRVVKLVLGYDGTDFAGWQRQAGRSTIQQTLEEALAGLTGEAVAVVGAGRTDAGVHAVAQVASFRTRSRIPAEGFVFGTNARLPETIGVTAASDMPPGFHAQRDAKGKHYRYRILNRRAPSALDARFVHRVGRPLDEAAMAGAAAVLVGTHDFSSFRNVGSVEGPAVRTVARLDVSRAGEYVSVDVEGDGFLYKMVRNLVGTLLLVGLGRIGPEEVRKILDARDRRKAGPAAPARGLTLIEVRY